MLFKLALEAGGKLMMKHLAEVGVAPIRIEIIGLHQPEQRLRIGL